MLNGAQFGDRVKILVYDGTGLCISPPGREVRARLRPLATGAQDAVMTPLSEAERDELRSLLGRVIKASDALREV